MERTAPLHTEHPTGTRGRLLIFAAMAAATVVLQGCATPAPRPFRIAGHPIEDIVLHAPKAGYDDKVELPAGSYFSALVWDGFGFGEDTYFVVFSPGRQVKGPGLFGKTSYPGGIRIAIDPKPFKPKVYVLTHNGGGSLPLPNGFTFQGRTRDGKVLFNYTAPNEWKPGPSGRSEVGRRERVPVTDEGPLFE